MFAVVFSFRVSFRFQRTAPSAIFMMEISVSPLLRRPEVKRGGGAATVSPRRAGAQAKAILLLPTLDSCAARNRRTKIIMTTDTERPPEWDSTNSLGVAVVRFAVPPSQYTAHTTQRSAVWVGCSLLAPGVGPPLFLPLDLPLDLPIFGGTGGPTSGPTVGRTGPPAGPAAGPADFRRDRRSDQRSDRWSYRRSDRRSYQV
jgi:hypothetical protein